MPTSARARASCPAPDQVLDALPVTLSLLPKSYLAEISHMSGRPSPIAGPPGLRSAKQVLHVPSPEGLDEEVGEEWRSGLPGARPHRRRRRLLRRLVPAHDQVQCGEQAGGGQPPRCVPDAVAAGAPGNRRGDYRCSDSTSDDAAQTLVTATARRPVVCCSAQQVLHRVVQRASWQRDLHTHVAPLHGTLGCWRHFRVWVLIPDGARHRDPRRSPDRTRDHLVETNLL